MPIYAVRFPRGGTSILSHESTMGSDGVLDALRRVREAHPEEFGGRGPADLIQTRITAFLILEHGFRHLNAEDAAVAVSLSDI